jgi:hypothetical protein
VEKALKSLQPSTAGRIPILDGFARPGNLPTDRFKRGYYQCTVEVLASGSAGFLVRVRARITAWYTDRTPSGSGYRVLLSNGRLELICSIASRMHSEKARPRSTTLLIALRGRSPSRPSGAHGLGPMPRLILPGGRSKIWMQRVGSGRRKLPCNLLARRPK